MVYECHCLGEVSTDDLNDFTDIYREHCEVSGMMYFHHTPPLDCLWMTTAKSVIFMAVFIIFPWGRFFGFVGSNIRLHIWVVITQMVLCGCSSIEVLCSEVPVGFSQWELTSLWPKSSLFAAYNGHNCSTCLHSVAAMMGYRHVPIVSSGFVHPSLSKWVGVVWLIQSLTSSLFAFLPSKLLKHMIGF